MHRPLPGVGAGDVLEHRPPGLQLGCLVVTLLRRHQQRGFLVDHTDELDKAVLAADVRVVTYGLRAITERPPRAQGGTDHTTGKV